MIRIWIIIGRILFWVTRPGTWLVILLSPPRTRVVVLRDDKILVVKDWLGTGRWKLPGGGLHRGEDPQQGAVRELIEEVNLRVSPNQLRFLGKYKLRSSGAYVRLIAYWVEVGPTTEAHIHGLEMSAAQWVSIKDLASLDLTEATKAVLEAFDKSQSPI